jgi:hypothetical protein
MGTTIYKISSYVVWNSKVAVLPVGVSSGPNNPIAIPATEHHNNLLGLQGGEDTSYEDSNGIMGEYYHLDASAYFALLPLVDDSVVGNSKYYGTNNTGVKGFNSFPIATNSTLGMVIAGTGLTIDGNGVLNASAGSPGAGTWGSITGTIGSQTDLQNALGLKLNAASYTASDVLTKLLTVDGTGSGLDADLLDGHEASYFALSTGQYWQRNGIIISPVISGDTISTSGTGYFSGSGSKLDLRIGTTKYLAIDTSLNNIRIGAAAGNDSMSTNGDNILIGRQAGYSMTSASANSQLIGIGYMALRSFTTGSSWALCIGPYAGNAFTSGDITAIGNWAARYSTSNCLGVTTIGHFALCDSVTGSDYTTAIGSQALYHAVSANSVAIGAYAGRGVSGQTTGDNNVFIGAFVASSYTTGTENVRIGSLISWDTLTSGSYNTTIGRYAGKNLVAGSNNTLLGWQAGVSLSSGSRNLILGYNVDAPSVSTNDYLAIGYSTTKLIEGSVASGSEYLKSNFQLQTAASTTTKAGLNIPHGTAPSAPANGDIWTTTVGLYVRINGSTIGPLGTGGGVTYTFQYSLTESAGNVNLVNDSATPGNSKYYGTNSSGTKGFFDLPSGGGGTTPVDSTLLDWSTDRYIAYATKQSGGEFYSDGNTLPTATTILNYNGCFVATHIDAVGDIMAGGGTGFGVGAHNIFLEKSAAKISITYSSVELCHLHPAVTNGSTAIAYYYNTIASLTTAGAKLASWQNNSVEKVAITKDGSIYANLFIHAYEGVSDSVILSHDVETNSTSTSYTPLKTITLGSYVQPGRTLRIKFDMKSSSNTPPYVSAKIYRNGAGVGTEQGSESTSYATYSEDITNWSPGDTIELWAKAGAGETVYVKNFEVCGNMNNTVVNEITGINS